MPRANDGQYSLPFADVEPGTVILSEWANTTLTDVREAISDSIAKTGVTEPTASLPMSGFRHTNVGEAVNRNEYATIEQVQKGVAHLLLNVEVTNEANDVIRFTGILPYHIGNFETGTIVRFRSTVSNTAGVRLSISGANVTIYRDSQATELVAGDIQVNDIVEVIHNGNLFVLNKNVTPIGDINDILNGEASVVPTAEAVKDYIDRGVIIVSATDTFPGPLDVKLLATGLADISTTVNGGYGTTIIGVDVASRAEAEAGVINDKGMTPLRTKQLIDDNIYSLVIATQAEATAGTENTKAMSALRTKQAIDHNQRAIATQTQATAGILNDVVMTPLRTKQIIDVNSYTLPIATQAEAEAGVENTKAMSALRTQQAIDSSTVDLDIATQAEALAGTDNTKVMTPLRTTEVVTEATYPRAYFVGISPQQVGSVENTITAAINGNGALSGEGPITIDATTGKLVIPLDSASGIGSICQTIILENYYGTITEVRARLVAGGNFYVATIDIKVSNSPMFINGRQFWVYMCTLSAGGTNHLFSINADLVEITMGVRPSLLTAEHCLEEIGRFSGPWILQRLHETNVPIPTDPCIIYVDIKFTDSASYKRNGLLPISGATLRELTPYTVTPPATFIPWHNSYDLIFLADAAAYGLDLFIGRSSTGTILFGNLSAVLQFNPVIFHKSVVNLARTDQLRTSFS